MSDLRLVKTAIIVFIFRIVATVLSVVGVVYFATELGSHRFGVFVLFQALVRIAGIGAGLGIPNAIEKRISEKSESNVIATGFIISAVPLTVIAVIVYALSPQINAYVGSDLALLLVPVVSIRQLGRVFMKGLRGELRVREAAAFGLLRRILFITAGILGVFLGFGVIGLVGSIFGSWFVITVGTAYRVSTNYGRPTRATAWSLIRYARYNFIAAVLGSEMYSWVDTTIIGLFLTQSHVAAYEIAWRITTTIMLFSDSLGQAIFPQVSEWDGTGDSESINQFMPKAITGSLFFVFPAIVGTLFFAEEILRFFFNTEYVIASTALVILAIGKIPEGCNDIISRVVFGIDKPELAAKGVIVFIVLNVSLNFVLIPAFGITGAAIATTTSIGVLMIIIYRYLSRYQDIRMSGKDLKITVLAAIVMGAVLYPIETLYGVDSLIELIVVVLVGGVIYFSCLTISPRFRIRMQEIGSSILAEVRQFA